MINRKHDTSISGSNSIYSISPSQFSREGTTQYHYPEQHTQKDKTEVTESEQVREKKNGFDVEDEDDDEYPEGGLRAWVVTFGCFCGLVACYGLFNLSGVIETYIAENQLAKESSSTVGWIFSLLLFTSYASCIFSGTYFDRNGFKVCVAFGGFLQVAGLIATANSTKVWHFILAFSILSGFGNGIILSPLISAPAHYFKRRRGTATAFSTLGGSIAGALFPLMLRKMFALKSDGRPYFGFEWGIRTLALIDLVLIAISVILVKERLPHVEAERPENEAQIKYLFRIYFVHSFDAKAFLDKKYFFCVLGTVLGELSLCSIITYFASYATSQGVSQADAYMLVMVINLTGILGRWLPGRLSDSFGRFNVSITTLVCLSIVMLVGWLPFANNLSSLYVIAALYGFFSASIFSLLPVCCGQISKTEEFGRRYATMYFIVAFSTLVGIPIAGAIIGDKSKSSYQHYIIYCAVTSLFSAVCFIISRYYAVGPKWKRF